MTRQKKAAADEAPPADRLVAAARTTDDDPALRPQMLSDFVGQARARRLLAMYLDGARSRGERLDHTLLYGPPGLGKTTLAKILANEMGASCRTVMAPSLRFPGDLVAALVCLSEGDFLFIDEIHRLNPAVEEVLYPAMEDGCLDLMVGEAGRGQIQHLELPRFTLVGATTRSGMLTRPLRERFGIDVKLDLYPADELAGIATRSAGLLGMELDDEAALEVAKRSRGTPRIVNRLLRRVRDFAAHVGAARVDGALARDAFDLLMIDPLGLDELDQRYLALLRTRYRERPAGLETLAAALGEDAGTLENEVEPWLVLNGLVERTQRGRVLGQGAPGSQQRLL